MKWTYKRNPWRRKFAIIPVCVEGECIWLRWYWARWMGDCREVEFGEEKPRD